MGSVLADEDAVVVWGDSPVLRVVVLIWVVLLVVSKETVKLDALPEVLNTLHASDVLEEVEISEHIDASSDESVPVDALQLDIGVILLELEVDCLTKVDVWSLDGMHVFTRHLKLIEVEILREHLHYFNTTYKNIY